MRALPRLEENKRGLSPQGGTQAALQRHLVTQRGTTQSFGQWRGTKLTHPARWRWPDMEGSPQTGGSADGDGHRIVAQEGRHEESWEFALKQSLSLGKEKENSVWPCLNETKLRIGR